MTIAIFSLNDDPYPFSLWDGIPGEGGRLIAELIYQKKSIWNVYQPETYRLPEVLKGVHTLAFTTDRKIHIRDFSFARRERAWLRLTPGDAQEVYGDSFRREGDTLKEIGNNVSVDFGELDFGEKGAAGIRVSGHSLHGKDTIHVRFVCGDQDVRRVIEFENPEEGRERVFAFAPVKGRANVSLVFLPGSSFDLDWIEFLPNDCAE
jgi:beta-galactosidase